MPITYLNLSNYSFKFIVKPSLIIFYGMSAFYNANPQYSDS